MKSIRQMVDAFSCTNFSSSTNNRGFPEIDFDRFCWILDNDFLDMDFKKRNRIFNIISYKNVTGVRLPPSLP
jgi:hypothetical protein